MNILKILTDRRKIGNFGEKAAVSFLRKRGYKILAVNQVEKDCEIDVIAKNREFIIFTEVKTRRFGVYNPSEPRAASAVTPEKQRKIIKAASSYLSYNKTELKVRFDVVEVYYEGDIKRRVHEINHLEGAFNRNTAYSTKGYKT